MLNFIALFLLETLSQEFFLCHSVSVLMMSLFCVGAGLLNYSMLYGLVCCCRLLVTWMSFQAQLIS